MSLGGGTEVKEYVPNKQVIGPNPDENIGLALLSGKGPATESVGSKNEV